MILQDVKPTRMELNNIRIKIAFSERGHKLLEMKRDGLMLEFFKIFSKARDIRTQLVEDYKRAEEQLKIVKCIDGENAINSAAFATAQDPKINLSSKNVMGVVVPTTIESSKVKRRTDQRGYGVVGVSTRINEAADAYEQLIEDIIVAAELETALKRLIDEIQTTKRKANALKFKIIPELKETEAFIRLRLEEMEKENIFRLRKIKKS